MMKIMIAILCFFALSITSGFSETKAERYAKEMAKYKQTDTFENCIRPQRIKRTKVLDDTHIIFEMRGKKVFLNTLDFKCSRLGFERKFAYSIYGSRLCNTDTISVLDSFMGASGGCGLGKFQVLEELPRDSS